MAKTKGAAERLLAAGWSRVPLAARGDRIDQMWLPPGTTMQPVEERRLVHSIPPDPQGRTREAQDGKKTFQIHVTPGWQSFALATPAAIAWQNHVDWQTEQAAKGATK